MIAEVTAYCRGCAHYYADGDYIGCVYAANMSRLRPCPAGDGCTEKISRLEWLKQMRAPRTVWTPEMVEQLQKLLLEGLDHTQIADKMGLRVEAVAAKVGSLPQVTHFNEEDELTAKMKKSLEGFVPVNVTGEKAGTVASEPKNGGVLPEDAPHDATSSVTADAAPPSPQGEGETEPRKPFKNKPTELLYQLLQEATADMAVRIDGAPIKEVCVSVKFDEGGNESGREIYLGF